MLWQITAPHYCAGLIVEDGKVTQAAPILKWSIGKSWREVKKYLIAKGYHGEALESEK